jgi:hypothetical protein
MGPHQVPDFRLPGAQEQVAQERRVGINSVDRDAEFPGERQRLAARTAAGIDDDAKRLFREEAQDVQGVGVTARAELFHAAEEQADRIGVVHVRLDCLVPQMKFSRRSRPQRPKATHSARVMGEVTAWRVPASMRSKMSSTTAV